MNEFWDVVNKVDEHVKHNLGKEVEEVGKVVEVVEQKGKEVEHVEKMVEEVGQVGKENKNNQIETWS